MTADKRAIGRGYFIKIPEATKNGVKLFIGMQLSFLVKSTACSNFGIGFAFLGLCVGRGARD